MSNYDILKDLLRPSFNLTRTDNYREAEEIRITLVCNGKDVYTSEEVKAFNTFVEEALNEKYGREFGEPKRWIKDIGYHYCQNCKDVFYDERNPCFNFKGTFFRYCPNCGTKLSPPKKENKNE